MKSFLIWFALVAMFASSAFADRKETTLAKCHAIGLKHLNSSIVSIVGLEADVAIVQTQDLPYINDINIQPLTNSEGNFGAGSFGLPSSYDKWHISHLTDDSNNFHLSYCAMTWTGCTPNGSIDLDQKTLKGSYSDYEKHCEPSEHCPVEVREFSITCDKPIHVLN